MPTSEAYSDLIKLGDIMTRLIELGVSADMAAKDHDDFVAYAFKAGQTVGMVLHKIADLENRVTALEGFMTKEEVTND